MGQPGLEGNYKGYEESDVTRLARHFHPTRDTLRKLYLVHGSRDDNVHLQHSMVLAKELVREGVAFKQQVCDTRNPCLGLPLMMSTNFWIFYPLPLSIFGTDPRERARRASEQRV